MDYDRLDIPASYDAGRSYSPRALARWLEVIARNAPKNGVSVILDLGSGTGRYSAALAERFDARVIAIDPSEKMLAEACRKLSNRVVHLRAPAEAIPLRSAALDMVFISMVFHHFTDRARAVSECYRVLRSGGVLYLRAGTRDRIPEYAYVPFFPTSVPVLRSQLQEEREIESVFLESGFTLDAHELVMSEAAETWKEYATKIARRADSILVQLADAEFEAGMRQLDRYAAEAPPDVPVCEPVDFFAFRRT